MSLKELMEKFEWQSFSLCKKDINPIDDAVCAWDPGMCWMIESWMKWCTREQGIETNSEVWKSYVPKYIGIVVLDNPNWPHDIPIGYVFKSLIHSTGTMAFNVREARQVFDSWIRSGDNCKNIYKAYRQDVLYVESTVTTTPQLSGIHRN